MQNYVKKREPSRFRDGNKSWHESTSREEDHPFQPPQNVIGGNNNNRRRAIHRKVIQIPQESMLDVGEQRPYGTPVQAETNEPRYVFQRGRRKGGKATL